MHSLPESLHRKCEHILDETILSVESILGGDINEARLLKTKNELFFLKYNSSSFAYEMLSSEAKGLNHLRDKKNIKIPKVIFVGKADQTAFLILEYIEPQHISIQSFQKLGEQLALLHQNSQTHFGLDHDNFIGTLSQKNSTHTTWISFFIANRIFPQIEIAKQKNLLPSPTLNKFESLYSKLIDIFPNEAPALIHGDLWKGNFIISKNKTPVLIDPSISYSHREMDLAMTKLFGGFDPSFYEAYQSTFPLAPNFENRVGVYQLYYLLVHLNLFGSSYLPSIQNILNKFV